MGNERNIYATLISNQKTKIYFLSEFVHVQKCYKIWLEHPTGLQPNSPTGEKDDHDDDPTGLRKIISSIPVGNSLSHARKMMNIKPFITELIIYHFSLFITAHEAFGIADPSSTQIG